MLVERPHKVRCTSCMLQVLKKYSGSVRLWREYIDLLLEDSAAQFGTYATVHEVYGNALQAGHYTID